MICPKCERSIPDDALRCCYCGKKVAADKTKKPRRAAGTGCIAKLPGRRKRPWWARLGSGTHVYSVGTFATKAEAERAIALFTPPDKSIVRDGMTLREVYNEVMRTKEGKIGDSSLDTYRAAWKHIERIADAPVAELKAADFQRVIDGMKGYSRSSLDKVKVLVSLIYNFAISNNLTVSNPARFLELPKPAQKRKKETFSSEDIAKLWTDGSPDAEITLVMIYTGMRINELFSLNVTDVHYDENGYNYIIGGEKSDAGRDRTIIIHDRILPILRRWTEQAPGEALLTGPKGARLNDRNWRERNFYPMLDRLGIERLNPHKARHTFATLAARNGANPTSLQRFLGHADFATTAKYYIETDLDDLQDTVKKLS